MIAWIAAALVGQVSSSEIESLVRDLGNDVLEVRERAHRKLLEAGAAALPALDAAAKSNDAELRLRAAAIAKIVGRAGRERRHDDAQKAELLRARDSEAEKRPGSAAAEGARFDLDVSAFEGGWVIRTFTTDYLSRRKDAGPGQGRLAFDVQVLDSQGDERVVDKCAKCSPKKVFVRGTNFPVKVRVLGSQTWFSPYELVFKDPVERQSRRVGDFTIEVIAGGLTVSSPDAPGRADAKGLILHLDRAEREREHDALQLVGLLRQIPTEGPRLDLNGYPWKAVTKTAGFHVSGVIRGCDTVIRIHSHSYLARRFWGGDTYGGLDFEVLAETPSGKALTVERCSSCSPGVVLVKNHDGPLRIRLKGTETWFSEYQVEFENPRKGDVREVGDMTVEVAWPRLLLKSKAGWSSQASPIIAPKFDYDLKPGSKSVKPRRSFTMEFGCGWRPPPASWCRCENGPTPGRSSSRRFDLTYVTEDANIPLGEVARIKATVWKPVEIPFELSVDVSVR